MAAPCFALSIAGRSGACERLVKGRKFQTETLCHQPGDQGVERRAEIGILPSHFFQPCLFIGRVDKDRIIEGREGLYQRFRESAPWILVAVCEEFPMMRHAIAIDCVQ